MLQSDLIPILIILYYDDALSTSDMVIHVLTYMTFSQMYEQINHAVIECEAARSQLIITAVGLFYVKCMQKVSTEQTFNSTLDISTCMLSIIYEHRCASERLCVKLHIYVCAVRQSESVCEN